MAHDVVFRVVLFQKHILEPLGYYLGNQRDTAIAVRFRLFTQSVAVTYSERQRERERERVISCRPQWIVGYSRPVKKFFWRYDSYQRRTLTFCGLSGQKTHRGDLELTE